MKDPDQTLRLQSQQPDGDHRKTGLQLGATIVPFTGWAKR